MNNQADKIIQDNLIAIPHVPDVDNAIIPDIKHIQLEKIKILKKLKEINDKIKNETIECHKKKGLLIMNSKMPEKSFNLSAYNQKKQIEQLNEEKIKQDTHNKKVEAHNEYYDQYMTNPIDNYDIDNSSKHYSDSKPFSQFGNDDLSANSSKHYPDSTPPASQFGNDDLSTNSSKHYSDTPPASQFGNDDLSTNQEIEEHGFTFNNINNMTHKNLDDVANEFLKNKNDLKTYRKLSHVGNARSYMISKMGIKIPSDYEDDDFIEGDGIKKNKAIYNRIDKTNKIGNLSSDYNAKTKILNLYNSDNNLVYSHTISADLFKLLFKRFDARNSYSMTSIKNYRSILKLAGINEIKNPQNKKSMLKSHKPKPKQLEPPKKITSNILVIKDDSEVQNKIIEIIGYLDALGSGIKADVNVLNTLSNLCDYAAEHKIFQNKTIKAIMKKYF